jgi:hypothetical protein
MQQRIVRTVVTVVAMTLTLLLVGASAAAAPPGPGTPSTTATTSTTVPGQRPGESLAQYRARHKHESDVYWYHYMLRRQADQKRRADARYVAILRLAAAMEAQNHPSYGPYAGVYVEGIQVCNGVTLPSCYIVKRESNFQPHVRNSRSSAGGLYQFLSFWARKCGIAVSNMAYATVAQQVRCAHWVWTTIGGSPWGA